MTYYSTPQVYTFTAYSEEELGTNMYNGATFTMPSHADLCIEVADDDKYLSGDSWCNENANDGSYQVATILDNGTDTGNGGQIYAEQYFWLQDQNGTWYVMVHIEQEGSAEDYFTFYTGHGYTVPPEGAELTVKGKCNVTHDWLKYDQLDGGEKAPDTGTISGTVFCDEDCDGINGAVTVVPGCDYIIEAEDMHEHGFRTVSGSQASGHELVRLECLGDTGRLWSTFSGKDGTYDITIRVQDENDGQSVIKLKVNGHLVEAVRLDADTDGRGSNNGGFSDYVIRDVDLSQGDEIKLVAYGDSGEYVRIDKLLLEGQDETVATSEPTKEGVEIKLIDASGAVVATTTTDANGDYSFDAVAPGEYKIMGVAPDGTEFTIQDAGSDDSIDSDVDSNGMSGTVTVAAGQTVDIDLGVCDKPFRECDDPDAVKVDFEGFAAGTVINTQYAGITIEAQRDRNNTAENDAMVFDSANPTGGDSDLETASQGNILIVSEDNDSDDPDDAIGGTITFTFENPSLLYDLKVIDTEEGGTITVTLDNGSTMTFDIPQIGDGEIDQVLLDVDNVVEMTVTLNGSGAIDDLCYVPGAPQPGSLSGRYFCDTDRDDVDDGQAIDPGVAGVLATLVDAAGNPARDIDGNLVDPVMTGPEGEYTFGNLAAGTYKVIFTDPDGVLVGKELVDPNVGSDDSIDSDAIGDTALSEIDNIVVAAGENTPDNDAGVAELLGALSGRYFCDDNRDDTEADGSGGVDVGVGGKTVSLYTAAGVFVTSTTTQADGSYRFDDLEAGDYYVEFEDSLAEDKAFVAPNVGDDAQDSDVIDPGTGRSETVNVAAGEETTDLDAGVAELLGALSGRYFCDDNRDDTEADGSGGVDVGVGGKTVSLYTAAGVFVTSTTTQADGSYRFDDLEAGDYYVEFEDSLADGKAFVMPNVGDDAQDSDVIDPGTGRSETVNVAAGEETTDLDAGVVELLGALSGRYFCDENDDSLQGSDEPGIAGVIVRLLADLDNDGQVDDVLDTTTTGTDGRYEFTDLSAGEYAVNFDADPTGKTFVTPNVDGDVSDDIDSDGIENPDGTATTAVITLAAGETSTNNDVGVEDPGTASVGDQVWIDTDKDGLFNNGEMGLNGVSVTLLADLDGDGDVDDFVASTTTQDGGRYLFDGLDAGTYAIRFGTAPGYEFTTPSAVAADAADNDSDADLLSGLTDEFVLSIGEAERDIDAGLFLSNLDPELTPDMGKGCADEEIRVDLSDNISDPEGDPVTITALDGVLLTDGGPAVDVNGVFVRLEGNELVFDGEAAYAGLDIGQEATQSFTYTVEDDQGGSAASTVDVTFCGDANSVQSLCDTLPDGLVTYQVRASNISFPIEDFGFNLKITDAGGDARFEGVIFEQAYCLSAFDLADAAEFFGSAPFNTADMFCADEATADLFNNNQVSNFNGETALDNLDMVNWILNEDFEGQGFTGWEVQLAIWELTDDVDADVFTNFNAGYGDIANVDFILSQADQFGEGFTAGVGDVVGIILDPNPATSANSQPFIFAVNYEDIDCLC